MRFLNKKRYFRIISFLLIITTYLPVITKNLPPIIRSHHLWAGIWVVSLFLLHADVFRNKFFVYVILYQIFFFLLISVNFWLGIDNWTLEGLGLEFYYFSIAISLILYYRSSNDYYGLAILMKWSMVFVGVTAVMSIFSSYVDPLYARKIIGGEYEISDPIFRYGGGAYGYSVSLVCLFPIMFYYYRNNSMSVFSRSEILIFGFICFFALVRIQIFANIIIAAFVVLFSFSGRKRLNRSLLAALLFALIIIIIPSGVKSDILQNLSGYFSVGTENKVKMDDLSDYLFEDNKATMSSSRLERYPLLWDAFKMRPVFGYYLSENTYSIGAGAHLYFMYRLTAFGLINFIFFSAIFILHIKFNMKVFNENYAFYFLLSSLSVILLGLIKTLGGRELWYMYFFLIPGLYYLPVIKGRNTKLSIANNFHVSGNDLFII